MKKKVFISLAATMFLLANVYSAFSQKVNKSFAFDPPSSSEIANSPFPGVSSGHINDISSKVIRDFVKRVKYTAHEKWNKVNSGYIAFFEKDSIKFKVSYDTRGDWVNTMRTYTEKYLPLAVRHPVKSAYYDYNIYQVTEVESDDQPLIYLIYLRRYDDETSLKDIMYSDGEMQEVEQFRGKWRKKIFSIF